MYDAFKVIRFGGKNMIQLDVNDMIFRKISHIPTFAEPAIKAVMLPGG
jgi:hypothetical protein